MKKLKKICPFLIPPFVSALIITLFRCVFYHVQPGSHSAFPDRPPLCLALYKTGLFLGSARCHAVIFPVVRRLLGGNEQFSESCFGDKAN